MVPESVAFQKLSSGELRFPPLTILQALEPESESNGQRGDFVLRLVWESWTRTFAVEYKGVSTPKAIEGAIEQVRRQHRGGDLPMVMTPYLAREQLDRLLEAGISGLDLSGNGVVVEAGRLLVYRTGAPNQYPQKRTIEAVYEGKSSLVARVLLVKPRYDLIKDVRAEIERRGGEISLPTVSKVLRVLEDDLLIAKRPIVELRRPETLLERLLEGYLADPVEIRQRVTGKLGAGAPSLKRIQDQAISAGARVVAGTSGPEDPVVESQVMTLYVNSADAVTASLPIEETDRFPDIEVRVTRDPRVYFDARTVDGILWVSPVQRYLELATAGKREKELAAILQDRILATVRNAT